jgi:virulence plasmid B protein/glycosyltransferase TcdB-like subunit of Tc toxin/glycosyltransferase TcdB-like subunit of Tc toxinin/VCBS repeat protein
MGAFGDDSRRGSGQGGSGSPGPGGGYPGSGAGAARPPGLGGGSVDRQRSAMSDARLPGNAASVKGEAPVPAAEARRPPAQGPTPVEAPMPALPKGGGAIRSIAEKFGVAAATGAGSMAMALGLPPGRGGFGPQLALRYATGSGNGTFGLGWSLDLPAITRKTDKGLPRYVDDDRQSDIFILAGAEDLVPLLVETSPGVWERDVVTVAGERRERYRPRVEGAFARIERIWPEGATGTAEIYWRVATKDNVTSTFGKSAAARIADPRHPYRIFTWLLEETRDDRGNVVRYEYKAEDLTNVATTAFERHRLEGDVAITHRHPKRILYGNKAGVTDPTDPDDFHYEVVFDYGEHDADAPAPDDTGDWLVRQDAFSSYRATFELRTYRLCRRVLVYHRFAALDANEAPVLVSSLDLEYEESPAVTYLVRATRKGYVKNGSTYDVASLPPVELDYTRATLSSTVRDMDAASLAGVPGAVDGRRYQWIDLHGEGAPGLLAQYTSAYCYKRNQGGGKLGAAVTLPTKPQTARFAAGATQQLLDVTGSGLPAFVDLGRIAGYHARTDDAGWQPFRYFQEIPNVDWSDPSIRFIDLDGDGRPDVMMTGDHVYTWWRSKGSQGFGDPRTATRSADERKGPTVVFREAQQTIFLADMTGDGLQDLVRIQNGSVGYFPNLGYGHFGPLVRMEGAPDVPPNLYDPRRIRLADIDGTGTTDVLYIGRDRVTVWMNQAGNSFAAPVKLAAVPDASDLSTVDVVDLLGTGTACLVWSTALPSMPPRMRYVDLLQSVKPHLLANVQNNLGLETRIAYSTSTHMYLEDRAQGSLWATRVPFPVQVVERLEHYDHVSKHRFVTTYRYRHGFYDGEEREFRGFGYVEARDAESVAERLGPGLFPDYPVENGELPLPPVVTKSWFHTGAWQKEKTLFDAFAAEWWSESTGEPRLSMPALPPNLTAVELHQAHRALAGRLLRQELYAEDGATEATRPYSVTQSTWSLRKLQPTGASPYASFLVSPTETLTITYERNDPTAIPPRIGHELTIEVDELGYVTKQVSVAYPHPDGDYGEQEKAYVRASDTVRFHKLDSTDWYRHGIPISEKSWELHAGILPSTGLVSHGALATALDEDGPDPYTEVEFDETLDAGEKRLLAFSCTRYWNDNASLGPLALGVVHSRALPYESYAKALTSAMRTTVLDGNIVTETVVTDEGRYLAPDDIDEELDPAGGWWARTGIQHFRGSGDFYLLDKVEDVFGEETVLDYDAERLFVVEVTLPEVGSAGSSTIAAAVDYRVLAPWQITDANGHFARAAFDELGRVVATAVTDRDETLGDTLTAPDYDDATTRFTYELDRFVEDELPVRVKTELREQHGGTASWLVRYSYSNGSGAEVLTKIRVEPGPVWQVDENGEPAYDENGDPDTDDADPRWVGSGRLVLDNKGNPIKQYEPYFSDNEEYEEVTWGVTPRLHYDPLGRLVRTDFPDGSYSRVEFDPWKQKAFDRNDTTGEPGNLWYQAKSSGTTEEQDAAEKALAHSYNDDIDDPPVDPGEPAAWGTPTTTYFDALGRPVVVDEHERVDGTDAHYVTKTELDIHGNVLEVWDAKHTTTPCMTYVPSMLGQVLK